MKKNINTNIQVNPTLGNIANYNPFKTEAKMKNKVRIIKRTMPDGRVEFTIQERHFLFFWWWVDAWVNHDVSTRDSFPTLAEAQKNLCYFDGTKCREIEILKVKHLIAFLILFFCILQGI